MKLIIGGTYDLRPWIEHVAGNIDGRCAYCYQVRMEETARYAAENGYEGFTTSLLVSPYQKHDAIRAIAQAIGEKYGVPFVYRDFRPLFQSGPGVCTGARDVHAEILRLYFSEEDRYMAAKRKKEGARAALEGQKINLRGHAPGGVSLFTP